MNKKLFALLTLISLAILGNAVILRAEESEIQTNKDVNALKQEVIRRAEINLYPVFGIPRNLMQYYKRN